MSTMNAIGRLGLVLGLALTGWGCSGGGALDAAGAVAWTVDLTLADATGNPATEFAPGEEVFFELHYYNPSNDVVSLRFLSTCQADGRVLDDANDEVWHYLADTPCGLSLTHITLAPGESAMRRVPWDQTRPSGAPVAPGEYVAQGLVPDEGVVVPGTIAFRVTAP